MAALHEQTAPFTIFSTTIKYLAARMAWSMARSILRHVQPFHFPSASWACS
jgi:hypothetical protein